MSVNPQVSNLVTKKRAPKSKVLLPKWVNERYPPLHELLSPRDVARLTRRPIWILSSLALLGHFPRRLRFRGRPVGWRRKEVLDWLARSFECSAPSPTHRKCEKQPPTQRTLPFVCISHRDHPRDCVVPCRTQRPAVREFRTKA